MRDNEQKAGSVADQKNKIRERYKGVSIDELDVIPALPQEDIFAVENEQRVLLILAALTKSVKTLHQAFGTPYFVCFSYNQSSILTLHFNLLSDVKSQLRQPLPFKYNTRCPLVLVSTCFVNFHFPIFFICHRLLLLLLIF